MKRSLHDDVFVAFSRACEEGDLEVAEHLLRAIEVIARQKHDCEQLDAAYALLAKPPGQPRRPAISKKGR